MDKLFKPYLNLYAQGALPQRPWWASQTVKYARNYTRHDGWLLCMQDSGSFSLSRMDLSPFDLKVHLLSALFDSPLVPSFTPDQKGALIQEHYVDFFSRNNLDEIEKFALSKIEEVDTKCPVPRPPIWPGQYWYVKKGNRKVFISERYVGPEEQFTALLYGPSIYGRDVPWHEPYSSGSVSSESHIIV